MELVIFDEGFLDSNAIVYMMEVLSAINEKIISVKIYNEMAGQATINAKNQDGPSS